MQYKVFNFCTILFFSLISSSLFAQMSASGDMAELDMNSNTDIIFPSTENENIYYLDLEKVEGHLLDASVIEDFEIVERMNLADVRKDAFYELNLSELGKGDYTLKIRTFKKEYKFEIEIE